jgi:hypothetical protein
MRVPFNALISLSAEAMPHARLPLPIKTCLYKVLISIDYCADHKHIYFAHHKHVCNSIPFVATIASLVTYWNANKALRCEFITHTNAHATSSFSFVVTLTCVSMFPTQSLRSYQYFFSTLLPHPPPTCIGIIGMSRHMCVGSNFKALHYKASGYRISAIMAGRRVKSTAHAYHYEDEHERITMDKWRQRMLNSLKNGTKQKFLNAEQKKLCGRGLMVYYKLKGELKRDFIECWKSIYVERKWGANKCNLGWIKGFENKYYKRSFPNGGLFTRQSCTQLHACACVCMHASHWGHASLKN